MSTVETKTEVKWKILLYVYICFSFAKILAYYFGPESTLFDEKTP